MAPTFITLCSVFFSFISILFQSDAAVTGVGHRHEHLHKSLQRRAPVLSSDLPTGYESVGCYTDAVASRALYSNAYVSNSMTEGSCISFCSGKGYTYAGVEYSNECYCGDTIAASGALSTATDCNMPCAGNATELCGGASRLNIFKSTTAKPVASGPVTNPGPPGWPFLGCYTDSTAARTLTVNGLVAGAAPLSIALCTQACQKQGYTMAGAEYGGECYCGNKASNGGGPAPDGLAGCNMVCNGNTTECKCALFFGMT